MADKIMLVDDEEGIRKVLGITLSDMGYDVFTAHNGEEALKVFRQIRPPIVLTDIRMPGIDGVALLDKIKKESPDTEVIMISGHGDMDLAIKSLQREATDFVTKPINDDILGIALKRAHERMSMRSRLREYTENLEKLVDEQSARLIEAERTTAALQTVMGLSSALGSLAGELAGGIEYLNEMPCLVSIHNKNLKVVAANELYKSKLGDRIGKDSLGVFVGTDPDKRQDHIRMTFETGQSQRIKETLTGADGGEIPVIVHTTPIRDRNGVVELVLEMSVDATEVRRLQDELRTTQQRYQQLFDEVPCYISVQDRDLRLIATNRKFEEDFGRGVGGHCYEVYKHREEPCRDCPVVKTFEDGQSHQAEMVVTSREGRQHNVFIWTAPIQDATGNVTQVMEMSTDITQIRQLQDHLSSLGLLVGTLSHGIKGLLTGLDGGMYILNSGISKKNEKDITEGWQTVKIMVDRVRSMVLNILYYAKERDLKWEHVDVLSFADGVASTVEPKLQDTEIGFVRDFDHSLGKFEVDASVVRSALINILENAMDACMQDKVAKEHQIIFRVGQDGDRIIFEIRDNGMGMDRETRENMFTLFFSSKGSKGTGLGLFISNQIIEQHGGAIEVDSKPGEGARFRIFMPKTLPEGAKTHNKRRGQACDPSSGGSPVEMPQKGCQNDPYAAMPLRKVS